MNLTAIIAAATLVSMLAPFVPGTQLLAILGIVVVVGSAMTTGFTGVRREARIAITVGAGFLAFLGVGAILGWVLPGLGLARPLTKPTLLVTWTVVLLLASVSLVLRRRDPVRDLAAGISGRALAWTAALCLVPLLSLVGAVELNHSGASAAAILAASAAVAMSCLAVWAPPAWKGPPRVVLLAVSVLTLTWQSILRGGWLAGFDTQHEFYIGTRAIQQASFPLHHLTDPYAGMLSLTVWPAEVHALTGVNLRTLMLLAPGIALAFTVVTTWSALRIKCSERASALLCTLFVVGSLPFIRQLPIITRQSYAVFFFSLLVLALVPSPLTARSRRLLVAGAGLGIAWCHYSSAYLAAAAVVVGYLLTLLVRERRSERVLTLPVVALVGAAAGLWGGLVAKTGSNFQQLLDSIRKDGFQFLAGSGNPLTRWLQAASNSQIVNASVIRSIDVHLRRTTYKWMKVDTAGARLPLVNVHAGASHGVTALGPLLSIGGELVAEVTLLVAVIGVLLCAWWCRRDPRIAPLAGVAVVFVVLSAMSRVSQTVATDFAPSRVQAQAYLLYVVVVGVAIAELPARSWVQRLRERSGQGLLRGVGIALCAVAPLFALGSSSEVSNLFEHGAQLPMELTTRGEEAQRLLAPADVDAAAWVAQNRPPQFPVQADRFGGLALFDYGLNLQPRFIASVDPVIVDIHAWILAYYPNVREGIARGGSSIQVGVFRFPMAYFEGSRAVMYVSRGDAVFGRIPTGSVPLASIPEAAQP